MGNYTSRTGAANELVVCADLLAQGWDVFRSMSPHSSCDLLAQKGDRILRIEVKTARRSLEGRLVLGRAAHIQQEDKHDVMATVIGGRYVHYVVKSRRNVLSRDALLEMMVHVPMQRESA